MIQETRVLYDKKALLYWEYKFFTKVTMLNHKDDTLSLSNSESKPSWLQIWKTRHFTDELSWFIVWLGDYYDDSLIWLIPWSLSTCSSSLSLYRCSHAYDVCEGAWHACNACNACNACDVWLPFGAHVLHVMHDSHPAHLSSYVCPYKVAWLSSDV